MPNKLLFADEAGCLTFAKQRGASRYFILCTVAMEDDAIATALLKLRRKLAWDGAELGDYFHASEDKQAVRDAVFGVMLEHHFTVQATIMEKSKAQPQVCRSSARFYKTGWYFHFKHGMDGQFTAQHETLITAACLGTKRERAAFQEAVDDVMRQTMRVKEWKTDFMPAAADPGLQVADYCAWALYRKWESKGKDGRSYELIKDRITYEYDLWEHGKHHHY
ncbi:MAG: DUF3800 domain-containing protein [Sphingosinicella sp.]|uniref:DUF3800 domain-containing protein n=1 Tax=Sphingosinicella sp. TaxID=1917971 RepID=UPI004037ED91